jgi:drug/metabolite transporter (DMT)-like permease
VSKYWIGVLLVLLYNALSASKGVYLGSLLQRLDPVVMLVGCFGLTAVFFNALQFRNIAAYVGAIRRNALDVVAANLFTCFGWYSFFLAMKYLEPAVSGAVSNAIGPVITLTLVGLGLMKSQDIRVTRDGVLASVATMVAVLSLGYATWTGRTGVGGKSSWELSFGLAMAVLCGVCVVGNTVYGRRLARAGLPADQVMAARFFLLLAGGSLLLPDDAGQQIAENIESVLVIAGLGIIVPLYALQQGIARLSALTVLLLLATVPAFVFAVQTFDSRLGFSPVSLAGITLTVCFSAWGIKATREVKPA